MSIIRAVAAGFALMMAAGCGNRAPVIEWVRALPDSVPRSGVAYLRVRAHDPERGPLSFVWEAAQGTVAPDSGDSTVYFAPAVDVDDTVRVTASDEQGLMVEGTVVIHVREGLCGGLPESFIGSSASLLVADSVRVYHVESAGGAWVIRWVGVDGVERDTVASRPHEIRRLVDGGGALFWLERDVSGVEPRLRVMTVSKADSAHPATVVEFPGRSSSVADIAVTASRLYVAWLETVSDSVYVARVTAYPRTGGAAQERFAIAGPASEATVVSRLAAEGDELFFLVTSSDPARAAVMRLPAAGAAVMLAGPAELAPGTLAPGDGLAVAGGEVFWSERVQGRIGRVGRDGSGFEFIVPAGGAARNVDLLLAATGFGNTGARLFWTVPDDLLGMIVPTGGVLHDLDRGQGSIRGFAANRLFLFYVRNDIGTSRMYRLLIP
jgi:hypothetical protein